MLQYHRSIVLIFIILYTMFYLESKPDYLRFPQYYYQSFMGSSFKIDDQKIQSLITQSYKKHRPKNYDDLYEKFYHTILRILKSQIQIQLIDEIFTIITSYSSNAVKKEILNHIEQINSIFSDSSVSLEQSQSNINYISQHNQSQNLHFLDEEVKELEKSQSFQYFQKVFEDRTNRQSQKTIKKMLNCNLFINETIYPEYHLIKQVAIQTDFENSESDWCCTSRSIIISEANIDEIVKKQNKNEVLYMQQFNEMQLKRKQMKNEGIVQVGNLPCESKISVINESIQSRTIQKYKTKLENNKPIDYKLQYQKKKKNVLFRKSIDFLFKRKF